MHRLINYFYRYCSNFLQQLLKQKHRKQLVSSYDFTRSFFIISNIFIATSNTHKRIHTPKETPKEPTKKIHTVPNKAEPKVVPSTVQSTTPNHTTQTNISISFPIFNSTQNFAVSVFPLRIQSSQIKTN